MERRKYRSESNWKCGQGNHGPVGSDDEKEVDRSNIEVHLLRKYVDDVLLIINKLKLGTRYKDGKVTWSAEAEAEDVLKEVSREQVTFKVIMKLH